MRLRSIVLKGLFPLAMGTLALLTQASTAEAQSASVPAGWHDPSPHKTHFVNVGGSVQLEVVDWGGSGPTIILLPASGATAHQFDNFAPKLTQHYRVYGVTRRGFGASGFDPAKYGSDRLGDDLVAVMNALELDRPILIGHSFGGVELSDIATRYPNRTSGLVYLEAAYSFAFRSNEAPTMQEFQEVLAAPKTPPPAPDNLASFAALQDYLEHMIGVRLPEAELRQRWTELPDGKIGKRRVFPGSATLTQRVRQFSHISAPALVIFASPPSHGPWLEDNPDPAIRAAVRAHSIAYHSFVQRQAKAVARGMPNARVVILPHANHSVFISNEAEVLREINTFLASLPQLGLARSDNRGASDSSAQAKSALSPESVGENQAHCSSPRSRRVDAC